MTSPTVRIPTSQASAPQRKQRRPPPPQPFVSATEPDWTRESKKFFEWAPSRSLIASIRSYQRHADGRGLWDRIVKKVAVFRYRLWSVICGADIPITTQIGGGLFMPHPNGIVIHASVRIGPNCLLFHQVTLGTTLHGAPQLGGHVDVGAGAKILGPVTVGDNAIIGANAVVVNDVPAGVTVVGIPARPIATPSVMTDLSRNDD